MSVLDCRLAIERLDVELAHELGAGYQKSERYLELLMGTGDPPTDRERDLVARARLIAAAQRLINHGKPPAQMGHPAFASANSVIYARAASMRTAHGNARVAAPPRDSGHVLDLPGAAADGET